MSGQEILAKISGLIMGILQVLYWYMEALYRQFVPPPMKSIDGDTVLVTGAVGGIGKEICKHIIRSGSNIKLVLWDLNETDLEKLAAELKITGCARGLQVFPFAVDISSRANIDECCKKVKETVGPVTIIFNNAGIAPTGNMLQLSNEQIEKTIQVNLMSHFWIIRQFLPDMVSRNHGRIVNICSMGGLKAAAHALPYFAAKFGVNGYTESLKTELALFEYDGIHLSTVYPYFVKTPMITTLELDKKSAGSNLPSSYQSFLEPEDVARKAVDGMRREYEYIYCPSTIPMVCFVDYLIPNKFRKAVEKANFKSFVYKDAEEQKRLTMPYDLVVKNGSANGHVNGHVNGKKAN